MSDYIQFKVYNLITNNSTKNILYFSEQRNDIAFQDAQSLNVVKMNLTKGVSKGVLLKSDNTLPCILTSDFRLISENENSVRNFTALQNFSYMKSSNNAKLVSITYG